MTSGITVDTSARGAALGDFYGIFFEDINHAADGGLYAQLVRNGSFEFCSLDNESYTPLTAWESVGAAELLVRDRGGIIEKNPHFVEIASLSKGKNGIRNLGFGEGMYFAKGERYNLSFLAKGAMTVRAALEDERGRELAAGAVRLSDNWERYGLSLTPSEETARGRLCVSFEDDGRIALDAVELFPADTYKGGVLRRDLAEALEELHPRFMRFPGGCLVHDGALDPESRTACYCWENTVGSPEARPSKRNNWGYNQSLGLGFYEYFLLCEQLGCEPLPVVPAGWNPHRRDACPLENMQKWADSALNLIEFANGDAKETCWGRVRAELGHPKPFRLKYLAIGNEEVGEEFPERWKFIADAVRAKHPKIKLIHSAGPFCSGSEYKRGHEAAARDGADLIDEHYYCSPEWFLANVDRYKSFPRRGPKVFLGEYASWGNDLRSALAEAAYMTGLENAAHAVSLACYAPLFCHKDYVNWAPDLIWFDNRRVCRTPNFYVQKLFAQNLGDRVLPVSLDLKSFPPVSRPISGATELCSDGAEGRLRDVRVINLHNGDTVSFGDFDAAGDFKTCLSEINLTDYELRFGFTKTGGRAEKGIYVNFGKEKDDLLRWEIGGWQNQDCLVSSRVGGRSSCLDQHIFSLETGRDYDLCLRVEGRRLSTYIDGRLMNSCEDKLPVIEELYVTASKIKKTGEVIVKAVNVREEACRAALSLGFDSEGTLFRLSGESLDAVNTFEREAVAPTEEPISLRDGEELVFPPLSVTVLRLKLGAVKKVAQTVQGLNNLI